MLSLGCFVRLRPPYDEPHLSFSVSANAGNYRHCERSDISSLRAQRYFVIARPRVFRHCERSDIASLRAQRFFVIASAAKQSKNSIQIFHVTSVLPSSYSASIRVLSLDCFVRLRTPRNDEPYLSFSVIASPRVFRHCERSDFSSLRAQRNNLRYHFVVTSFRKVSMTCSAGKSCCPGFRVPSSPIKSP